MTSEIRMFKALKEAGVEDPKSIVKLAISGEFTEDDFRYIRKKMAKTLQDLDMGDASYAITNLQTIFSSSSTKNSLHQKKILFL